MCQALVSRLGPLTLVILSSAALADVDGGIAPPHQVAVRATPDKAKLGEPFVVELTITHDSSQRYELMPPGDLGDFEYVESSRSRTDGKDSSTTTFKVTLQGFTLGKQRTPTLTLTVDDDAQLPIAGAEVELLSDLPPDAQQSGADLYDVRKPEEVAVRTWRLLYALAALVGGGLLAFAVYRFMTRERLALKPAVPLEPLPVRANRALDQLREQNLPAQGKTREFYFRLSEILRGYLGELYQFDALECTTPELLEALRTRRTPGLPINELSAFAQHSDFVRYAKAVPGPDEAKTALEIGYRIVHATSAAPVTPPPNAAS
jgi:hypothetical protein